MSTQPNLIYNHILIRFGELSTKGENKKDFIRQLHSNIKKTLHEFEALTFEKSHDRLYVLLNGEPHNQVCDRLAMVFGISSFSLAVKIPSNLEDMQQVALKAAQEFKGETFKMDTKRHYKAFLHSSDEINRACASLILQNVPLKVDVKKPQLRIQIEVREFFTYVMVDKRKGAGGYPVGSGGKALVMLSGGIDSPVAAYEAMKRGIMIECIHYASPPYTSQQSLGKVKDLASKLALYQGHIRLHIVPFTALQMAINANCYESYSITIMRRMMYRIAQQVATKQRCLALVNGESVGQVASQTLESMAVINEVVTLPVLRPLVCQDKLEIIAKAEKMNTYEISIRPFEDCCTIFTPKKPVTKPKLEKAQRLEGFFEYQELLDKAITDMESISIYPSKNKDEDLF